MVAEVCQQDQAGNPVDQRPAGERPAEFEGKPGEDEDEEGNEQDRVLKAFYKLGMFKTEYVRVKKKKVVPADVFQKLAPAIPDPTMMIKLLKEGTIENAVLACSTEVSGRKDGRNQM